MLAAVQAATNGKLLCFAGFHTFEGTWKCAACSLKSCFFSSCETFMSLPHGIELQLFSAIGTLTIKPVEKKLLLTYCALGRALELLPTVSKGFCLCDILKIFFSSSSRELGGLIHPLHPAFTLTTVPPCSHKWSSALLPFLLIPSQLHGKFSLSLYLLPQGKILADSL